LPRFSGGKKVPPQLQRMKSEDLLATVFPDQVACLENIVGERQVPDHPLVAQTLQDCLHEAMDTEGWLALLRALESGEVTITARDLTAPSVFASEALNAQPYAFLDDAPLEERRTQAVQSRRRGDPSAAQDLGRLDEAAIAGAREDAWPEARTPDEMHDALMTLGAITVDEAEASQWQTLLDALVAARRATRMQVGAGLWCATERLPWLQAVHPQAALSPTVTVPAEFTTRDWTNEDALRELVRGRLGASGPITAQAIADTLAVSSGDIEIALAQLEREGGAMRGHFDPAIHGEQWCERHLLARIHRNTLGRLRREIEPVSARDFMRFLCEWQHVAPRTRLRGPEALATVIGQLEGYEAAAFAWEAELLPARVADYSIAWLDELCSAGRIAWTRLRAPSTEGGGRSPVRATPLVLLPRRQLPAWSRVAGAATEDATLSSRAQNVAEVLRTQGALFFDELLDETRLLHTELEDALAELVARGIATCDSFAGLRALLLPQGKRPHAFGRRVRRGVISGIRDAGRWTLARTVDTEPTPDDIEQVARVLLRRYGVVGWRWLEREAAWLPPWRDLVRVFRRLEARGELRGGRFVAGVSGEQYALPEAVAALREVRRRAPDGGLAVVSGFDPLNLSGGVLAGPKLPRQARVRVALRDGLVAGTVVAGELWLAEDLAPEEAAAVRQALTLDRRHASPAAAPLA